MTQRLMPLAIVNIAIHIFGLIFALFGMRPGSPLVSVDDRIRYLSQHPLGWSLGWGVWMMCDLAVIAFLFQTARRLRNDLAWLAVGIILAGITVDLSCDSLFIVLLPHLAARQPVNEEIFLIAEKAINTISLVMGNGLITISTAVMTIAFWKPVDREVRNRLVYLTRALGIAIFIFGMLLSAAGFMAQPWLTEWMTGPTILSYCGWCGLVAFQLDRAGAST